MNFVEELKWRGMLHDMTPGTEEHLLEASRVGYIGFDPTAPSLTIGNYVQIMILTLFQKYGHKPIVLMGGATGRIGDPSMRETERELKSYDELDKNLHHQMNQFEKLLNFSEGSNKAVFRNNLDFYKNMNVLDFLRDVGKNLTVNYMMAKESVKKRIETGLSFTEFSYQLIQGYDFQLLLEQDQCTLQMGGSDQWGNITSGTEVIRRNSSQKAFALTTPLLTKADGTKFGKSLEGNIWLDPSMTSPYKFYQFWINADDRDIEKFMKYFSLLSHQAIEDNIALSHTDPRESKRRLAEELTVRIHSRDEYERVLKVSEIIFNPKMDLAYLQSMDSKSWNAVEAEIPSYELSASLLESVPEIASLLTEHAPIFPSKAELRRAVQGNALSINKSKFNQSDHKISKEDLLSDQFLLVEHGKKSKFVIKFS